MNFSEKNIKHIKVNKSYASKTKLTLLALLISTILLAQNGINYKAIIKDDLGNVVANDLIQIQFIILEGATNVYQETHTPTTDANGLIIVNIGEGTTSDVFADINWSVDDHFLNVQIDTGTGLIDLGTTQFMHVPYAIQAEQATIAQNVNGLEAIDEGNGVGWRLVDRNYNNYDNIGFNAIDLSFVDNPNLGLGATGSYAFSLGHNGTASGEHALAFGNQNYSLNDYAITLGNNNSVTGLNSTAIGAINQVTGDYAFAVGLQNEASEDYTFALGNNATASGEYSMAFGSNATASGLNSFAFGTNTEAIGDNSLAMFGSSEATANYSIALGINAVASGLSSIAIGNLARASAEDAVAIGNETRAIGLASTAMGSATQATEFASTALGSYTIASGYASTALGNFTVASGLASTAMGRYTRASGESASAFGEGASANSYVSMAIGRYNIGGGTSDDWIATDPLFEIGNGEWSGNTSNAMTVLKNGNVGIGTSAPQEPLHVAGVVRIGSETIEDTGNNRLSFNADLLPDVDNAMQLGNGSFRWQSLYVESGTINTSDRRSKTNIANLNYGLKEVMKLNPVSFNWKTNPNDDTKLGLIAQDLLEVIPEVVKTHDWETDENGNKIKKELERMGVYYSDLVPVLINAIKEQQKIIDNEKSINSKQNSQLKALLSRIEILESNSSN